MPVLPPARTGGQILADQLLIHGTRHISCVPGESYLAVLDALHDAEIEITVCRQEGGAAIMAEAWGKLTGEPGVCFVTRGPGSTNASPGVHIARQDSTPISWRKPGEPCFLSDPEGLILAPSSRWPRPMIPRTSP